MLLRPEDVMRRVKQLPSIAALGDSEDLDSRDAIQEALARCAAKLDGKTPPAGLLVAGIDHDHRVVIIPKEGWGLKPNNPVGVSHLAFAYSSLDELLFV